MDAGGGALFMMRRMLAKTCAEDFVLSARRGFQGIELQPFGQA